ncbi:hypothetical protein AC579_5459 [Pseudocercospora musae]|uniref:Uncharacterized protein n=1 Tax=Pseudocercospora musae TaxID=113226 RepID=A0A139IQA1_9PEZI|nr:hypothetical protein AC579_5459 [Pseudocercospora musae]
MEEAFTAHRDNKSTTMGTPGPFRRRLGQITRQYRNTGPPPASPLERFVYQDISHEPWPMIAKQALSDSGLDATSLRELNGRASFAPIDTVPNESNIDPPDLREARCSVRTQASGAAGTDGGGGRKRNIDEAERHVHGHGREEVFKRRKTEEDR